MEFLWSILQCCTDRSTGDSNNGRPQRHNNNPAVIGILTVGAMLFTHFDGKDDGDVAGTTTQVSEAQKDQSTKKSTPRPSIVINEVFITPVDTKLPSVFYSEIQNSGSRSAEKFQVRIDFGESTAETCEVVSSSKESKQESTQSPIQVLEIEELRKNESIYIVCNVNLPYFKNISIGGGNIIHGKSLNYDSYKNAKKEEPLGFWSTIGRSIVVVCFVAFVLGVLRLFD